MYFIYYLIIKFFEISIFMLTKMKTKKKNTSHIMNTIFTKIMNTINTKKQIMNTIFTKNVPIFFLNRNLFSA